MGVTSGRNPALTRAARPEADAIAEVPAGGAHVSTRRTSSVNWAISDCWNLVRLPSAPEVRTEMPSAAFAPLSSIFASGSRRWYKRSCKKMNACDI